MRARNADRTRSRFPASYRYLAACYAHRGATRLAPPELISNIVTGLKAICTVQSRTRSSSDRPRCRQPFGFNQKLPVGNILQGCHHSRLGVWLDAAAFYTHTGGRERFLHGSRF